MALSVKSPVAAGCRIVAAKVRAAGRADGALALNTLGQWNWTDRFSCRFAVLRRHAFLLPCGGLLFRSSRFLFRSHGLLFRGSGFHFCDGGLLSRGRLLRDRVLLRGIRFLTRGSRFLILLSSG